MSDQGRHVFVVPKDETPTRQYRPERNATGVEAEERLRKLGAFSRRDGSIGERAANRRPYW